MHIVIFTGGEYPDPQLTENFFSEHRPDYVIAADSGLVAAEKYVSHYGESFSPRCILGDMDSIPDASLLEKYPVEYITRYIEDKDYTDTELALEKAYEKDSSEDRFITLVGAGGGDRIDHFLGVFDLFASDCHADVWFPGVQSLWYAPSGCCFSISKLSLHDMISIARTTECRNGGSLDSEGLLWESGTFRKKGMPSISNRIRPEWYEKKKPVMISVETGSFILVLPVTSVVTVKSENRLQE